MSYFVRPHALALSQEIYCSNGAAMVDKNAKSRLFCAFEQNAARIIVLWLLAL